MYWLHMMTQYTREYVDCVWELRQQNEANQISLVGTPYTCIERSFACVHTHFMLTSFEYFMQFSNKWFYAACFFFASLHVSPMRIIILTFYSLEWNLISFLSSFHPDKRMRCFFFRDVGILFYKSSTADAVARYFHYFFSRTQRFHWRNIVFISAVSIVIYNLMFAFSFVCSRIRSCLYSGYIYHNVPQKFT